MEMYGMEKLNEDGQKAIEIDIKTNDVELKKIKSSKGVKILSAQQNGNILKIVATIDSSVSMKKPIIEIITFTKAKEANSVEIDAAYVTSSHGNDIMLNVHNEK